MTSHRRWILGKLVWLSGWLLRIAVSPCLVLYIFWLPRYLSWPLWVSLPLASIAPWLFSWTLRGTAKVIQTGRRLTATPLRSTGELKGKNFVLYLRPFEEDSGRGSAIVRPGLTPHALVLSPFRSTLTYEEELVKILGQVGTVVAIARPGQKILYSGARRLYLEDAARWKSATIELMETARLVVLAKGGTPGVEWEEQQARATVDHRRLILLSPLFLSDGTERDNDLTFTAGPMLQGPNPGASLATWHRYFTYLIYFNDDGEETWKVLSTGSRLEDRFGEIRKHLSNDLRPLLERIERIDGRIPNET